MNKNLRLTLLFATSLSPMVYGSDLNESKDYSNFIEPEPLEYVGTESPAVFTKDNFHKIAENAVEAALINTATSYAAEFISYGEILDSKDDGEEYCVKSYYDNSSLSMFNARYDISSHDFSLNNCTPPEHNNHRVSGQFTNSSGSTASEENTIETQVAGDITVTNQQQFNKKTSINSTYKIGNRVIFEDAFAYQNYKEHSYNYPTNQYPSSDDPYDFDVLLNELQASSSIQWVISLAIGSKLFSYNSVNGTNPDFYAYYFLSNGDTTYKYDGSSSDDDSFYTKAMYDPTYGYYKFKTEGLVECNSFSGGFHSGEIVLTSLENRKIEIAFNGCDKSPTTKFI